MKIFLGLFFSIAFLYGFAYKLEPIQVTKDITCFFGKSEPITKENGGHIANCCYVSTKNGFVVIDSGPTYAFASAAYKKMHNTSPLEVAAVINTHKHDDHWLGNGFYKELGAKIIGPLALRNSVGKDEVTRMEREVSKDAFYHTKVVYPDIYVDKNYTLKVGDTNFEIRELAPIAHTEGDLVVYIPNEAIFTGDLVFNDRLLSLRDADLDGWIKSLDKIEAMKWKVLISGHGKITDRSALTLTKDYLQDLKKEVSAALDDDIEMGDVTKRVRLEKYKDVKMYDLLNKLNILKAYQILEFEEEE